MRFEFSAANTESDVEQFFVLPLLARGEYLAIPDTAIKTKHSLATYVIDKGRTRKRYVPDYVIYSDGVPIVVIEVKNPEDTLDDAHSEAQLYALELNKRFRSGANPVEWVISTNGRDLYLGKWDQQNPLIKTSIDKLHLGSKQLETVRTYIGWDSIQASAADAIAELLPNKWSMPSEFLGENRVTLAKAGHNSLFEELDPLLRRYFNPRDKQYEEEIIKHAYVTTEEVTKYERSFEDFIRTRVIPSSDEKGELITTTKRSSPNFDGRLEKLSGRNQPFMQLVIGGVGSGKTSFIKRYFNYIMNPSLRDSTVYCRINFNNASDELGDVQAWVCNAFIECIKENFSHIIDTSTEEGLISVFSKEIRDRSGAYSLLKKSSMSKYNERLANDLLDWISDPILFAKSLARAISGDRSLALIIVFDNVDRRDREAQLKIFQTGNWFMNLTRSICIMTLRDETFEVYKDEKPLDAFLKTSNFYIRPPRFIDMVSKRLDLVISHIAKLGEKTLQYDIEGLGTVRYPATALGSYLTAVYVDLFRKKRKITLVLEGLSGKNARRSLEMFGAVLTSAHFDTRDFTNAALTQGAHHIQEAVLLRALMRTNYLYFKPGHGFVRNIYDFPLDNERPSHFLKFEILKFLVENRKKMGDTRYEGYFTCDYICKSMESRGFLYDDVRRTINSLILDELIVSEDLTSRPVQPQTSVRVRSSGYIHMKILAQRLEYVASCALITPVADEKVAGKIGPLWQINDPHNDARGRSKRDSAFHFLEYLRDCVEEHQGGGVGLAQPDRIGALMVYYASEALKFSGDPSSVPIKNDVQEKEYDRLFAD